MRVVQLVPARAVDDYNTRQEAEALAEAGHEVTVIGPARHQQEFERSGVLYRLLKVRGLTRAGRALEFQKLSRRETLKFVPDVVSCRDLDTLAAGVWVKRAMACPLIYDMHEVFSWMVNLPLVSPVIDRHERKLLSEVDLAVVCNEKSAEWLWHYGTGKLPTYIVRNCRNPDPVWQPPRGEGNLWYMGTLHDSRFVPEMVRAMDRIDGHLYIAAPKTESVWWNWLSSHPSDRITFCGTLPYESCRELLRSSDLAIMMGDPRVRINTLGPYNRLYDAMAVGRPSIGTAGTSNGDLISELEIGLPLPYHIDDYTLGVTALLTQKNRLMRLGKNAYEACKAVYNWDVQARVLKEAYARLEA